MDLTLLKLNPELAKDTTFNLKGIDLIEFADKLVKETAQQFEQRLKEQNKPDPLLTRNEVCKLLGITLTTLWHWDNKNILKPLRIGSKVRYRRSDVDKALINKGGQEDE